MYNRSEFRVVRFSIVYSAIIKHTLQRSINTGVSSFQGVGLEGLQIVTPPIQPPEIVTL